MELILSSSTKWASVALTDQDQLLYENKNGEQKSHSEILHSLIDQGLRSLKKDWSDIKSVSIDQGPGSFTGIRVTLNLAKSLSYSLSIPLFAFTSLQMMALQFHPLTSKQQLPKGSQVLTIINAYKNMVYLGVYSVQGSQVLEIQPAIAVHALEIEKHLDLSSSKYICVGDGYLAYSKYFSDSLKSRLLRNENYSDYPQAPDLAKALPHLEKRPPSLDWKSILPLYIRASEAEENKKGILFKPLE